MKLPSLEEKCLDIGPVQGNLGSSVVTLLPAFFNLHNKVKQTFGALDSVLTPRPNRLVDQKHLVNVFIVHFILSLELFLELNF